jgi:tryptophanyl-tRNA synthetase
MFGRRLVFDCHVLFNRFGNKLLNTSAPVAKSCHHVIMSGIQPTGVPHIGNWLAAIEPWRHLQYSPESKNIIISVVDLHAITVPQQPEILRRNISDMIASLLACGIDTKQTIIFQQSSVSEHANLGWLLGCLTTMSRLEHLPQWKEKAGSTDASTKEIPVGLFTYPVLQAADILIYKATHVPVGDDQLKHIELARHLAKLFNNKFGALFPLPQPLTVEFKRVRSLRNPAVKMSKSDKDPLSRILLNDSPDEIREKLRKAMTDSCPHVAYDPVNRPGVSNLIDILCAFTNTTVNEVCESSLHLDTLGLKNRVAEAIIERLKPVRNEIIRLTDDHSYLQQIISSGNERARCIASATYKEVQRLVGFV